MLMASLIALEAMAFEAVVVVAAEVTVADLAAG